MRRVKEVLRLAHELGYSHRQIAVSVRLGRTAVGEYLERAREAGIRYADVAEMSEAAVEALLFKCPEPRVVRPKPDWGAVAAEMRRRGVTLLLLWQEYREQHGDGYSYSQYRRHFRAHQRLSGEPRLRRTLAPASMCEVDYAGQTMVVTTPNGECQVSVFVGSLPFSTHIYAEASWTQGAEDWLGSHVRMFESWGGSVPKLVPDNLKTGISHASFYDPAINRSYLELARHYGIGVVPARVRKPRDKPLAENAVQQVERWVLAPLRNRVFFSLDDLNRAIRQGVAALNDRPLSADSTLTRAKLFETHEKPLLKALPSEPFEIGRWCRHKVSPDYHVVIEGVAYSVPYRLIGKTVDVHRTASLVSIFHRAERVASHARRLTEPGTVRLSVTLDEHRPANHRAVLRLSPEAVRETITDFGGAVAALAELIFQDADHPEQAARQVAGLIRLGARYGTAALQAAAAATLSANVRSYRYVRQWLASGQMIEPMSAADQPGTGAGLHPNVRGSTYYH